MTAKRNPYGKQGCFLKIENLSKSFRGLLAIENFNLTVEEGEIVSIIGPNGAGKTTLFNLITGFYSPDDGKITFLGHTLNGLKPYVIARTGISRTFQNIRVFPALTVLDNVRVALDLKRRYRIGEAIFHTRGYLDDEDRIRSHSLYLLEIFGLDKKMDEPASSLSYGEQRRLEIARALATGARLLLLDEPTAGMNPIEQRQAIDLIQFVRRRFNLTILLIEHQMNVVMRISERVIVMNFGRVIATGTPSQIQNDPLVIQAYLGEEGCSG